MFPQRESAHLLGNNKVGHQGKDNHYVALNAMIIAPFVKKKVEMNSWEKKKVLKQCNWSSFKPGSLFVSTEFALITLCWNDKMQDEKG